MNRQEDDDRSDGPGPSGPDEADRTNPSASRIWLAGLGALARARREGSKVFEALVREGDALQRRTRAADRLSEAKGRVADAAAELSERAAGGWDRLEAAFEDRLARGLHRLGVPSMEEFEELQDRVAELERALARDARERAEDPDEPDRPGRRTPRRPAAPRQRPPHEPD